MPQNTIKQRFAALDNRRGSLLERVREYAGLTIPSILPEDVLCENSELPVPFSSAAGRGMTYLSSRLVSALVPLNGIPFFNLVLGNAEPTEGADPTPEMEALSRIERRVMRQLSVSNLRSTLNTGLQHAGVAGGFLMQQQKNYNFTLYRLDQYVVERRPDGVWSEIIIKELVDPSNLPQALLDSGFSNQEKQPYAKAGDHAIYLHVKNDYKGGCSVKAEYDDRTVSALTKDYPICPFVVPRWTVVAGENYGRGIIEDNIGEIRAADVLAEALLDSVMANSEYRFGVNPAGQTELHDLQQSVNGDFVPAQRDDVFPIQLGSQSQVAMAQAALVLKEQNIGKIFLMNSAVQPTGERVTAEMVRVIANELEQALGGVFSDAAREILIPVIRYTMYLMLEEGLLLPDNEPLRQRLSEELKEDGILSVKVKTGLETLSRESDHARLSEVMRTILQLPPQAQETVKWPGLMRRWLLTSGVGELTGIVMSQKEVEEAAQAKAQAENQQFAQQQAISAAASAAEAQASVPAPNQ